MVSLNNDEEELCYGEEIVISRWEYKEVRGSGYV